MADSVSDPQGGGRPAGGDRAREARSFTAVLTRPAGQSAALAARLARDGMDVFEFPLIEIAPVEDPLPLRDALATLERYALVVFVSPNAIDHGLAELSLPWPKAVPAAAIGPGSVAALARHGLAPPAIEVICPAGADAGGGGAKSDWQLHGDVGYDVSRRWTVGIDYRFLSVDYRKTSFVQDVDMKGFVVAGTYHF